MAGELRRKPRLLHSARVRVSWEDSSRQTKYSFAKCLDVSEWGIKISLPVSLPAGTVIAMQSDQLRLACGGVVRHTKRSGAVYLVGVEFSTPLKLRPELRSTA